MNPELGDVIIAAAAELLVDLSYETVSIDAVAARAGVGKASIYRRWPNKAALVLDTIRSRQFPLGPVQDTGSLRGDLLALFLALQARLGSDALSHLTGVLVALRTDEELASAVREQLMSGWELGVREIVGRAVERREIAAQQESFLELFARVGPSMVFVRFLMGDGPITPAFVEQLVDDVMLPILHVPPGAGLG